MTDRRYNDVVSPPEALQAPNDGEGEATPRPRIDYLTRLLVVRLHHANPDASSRALAAQLGDVSESSVRRILAAYAQTKDEIKDVMRSDALDALEDWTIARKIAASKGYHQPTKDWLEAAQVIDAKPQMQATVNVKPTVHLSMNFGLGALKDYQPDPAQPTAIEATAVPVLPPKDAA